MKAFVLCLVPLFVAVDPIGLLPMFLGLTEGVPQEKIHRVIIQSMLVAMGVAVAFVAVGEAVFGLLGIQVEDFMIAGGALLFAISLGDMLSVQTRQRHVDAEGLGAVPIGVPLLAGPAMLATMLLLLHQHGRIATLAAAACNVAIAGLVMWTARPINRALGKAGAKTLSKLTHLLLMAIAVMIVRKGVMKLLAG